MPITTTEAAAGIGVDAGALSDSLFGTVEMLAWFKKFFTARGNTFKVLPTNLLFGNASSTEPQGIGVRDIEQNQDLVEEDPSFDAGIEYGAKKITLLTRGSQELIDDTEFDYNAWISRRAGYALALRLIERCMTGFGSATQGNGMRRDLMLTANNSRHVETAASSGVAVDDVYNMLDHIAEGFLYRPMGQWPPQPEMDTPYGQVPIQYTAGFVCSKSMRRELLKLERAGEPIANHYSLAGYPLFVPPGWPEIPSSIAGAEGVLGFGIWACYGLRLVGGSEDNPMGGVEHLKMDDTDTEEIRHRWTMRYDSGITDYQAFSLLNVKTT